MNDEKRILSLLYDGQLLVAESGASALSWQKSPRNLRRVLRERVRRERVDAAALGGLALSNTLLGLQKSVEALKSGWTAELRAGDGGAEELSYAEMLAYPADGLLAAAAYLAMYDERCLADTLCALGNGGLTRFVFAAQFDAWDARMEEVYATAAGQSAEPSGRESLLGDRSIVVRPAARALDAHKIAYLQTVHKFVLAQRGRERRLGESALGESTLGETRREKAVDALFDDFTAVAGESAPVFALARAIVCPEGRPATRERLLANARAVLESDFAEKIRRTGSRQQLGRDPPSLPPSLLEPLEWLNHYFEGFAASADVRAAVFLERDGDGLALWAVCWLGLRAGYERAVTSLLAEYRGSLQSEAMVLGEQLAGRGESFVASEGEDVFKRALSLLRVRGDALPAAFLIAEMADYIWFHLYRAQRYTDALARLQQRIAGLGTAPAIEAAKLDLLCLRLGEAVAAFGRAGEPEAAQLAFCFLYFDLLPREGRGGAETALLRFAQENARRFPLESLAYFEAVAAAGALADFFELNDLVEEFFGVGADARARCARAALLLGAKWPPLLDALATRRDARDSALVRLHEERGDGDALAELLLEEEANALFQVKRGEEPSPRQREYRALLTRVGEELRERRRAVGAEYANQALLVQRVRNLAELYFSKRRLRDCFAFLEQNLAFWEVPFTALHSRAKIVYLELIRLTLQVVFETRRAGKGAPLRAQLGLDAAAGATLVRRAHEYFYRQVRLGDVAAEPPFESPAAVGADIARLFTAVTLAE